MEREVLGEVFENFSKNQDLTVLFLHELMTITKFLTPNEKQNFVNNLCDFRIYEKLSSCLRGELEETKENEKSA